MATCWQLVLTCRFGFAAVLISCCAVFGLVAKAADVPADPDNPFATSEEKAAAAQTRTWNDKSGKFKLDAKMLRMENGNVVLRRSDDKEISVPLDKLCEADQIYVAKFIATKAVPAEIAKQLTDSDDLQAAVAASTVKLTKTNFNAAKIVSFGDSDEWNYKPDAVSGDQLPTAHVALKPVSFFDQAQTILLLPKEKKAFVVFYNDFQTHTSQVQACNLLSGELEAAALFAQNESPIDISPSGTMVLSRQARSMEDGSITELHLYSRDGNKVKLLSAWKPFDGSSELNHDKNVKWGGFTDDNHVLTLSDFGRLACWELPSLRPVWTTSVAFGTTPSFSAGRKYVVLVVKNDLPTAGHAMGAHRTGFMGSAGIWILNAADGSEAGHIALDEDAGMCATALRNDGARLALWQNGRIRVWDMNSRELLRDFGISPELHLPGGDKLDWTSDNHLLLENNLVVDVERRVPIWTYENAHQIAVEHGGKVWFVEDGAGNSGKVLKCAVVPPKAALDSVAKYKPEDLLVLHPGMAVSVDLKLDGDADKSQAAQQAIEERLKKNGMTISPNAKVKLVGSSEPGPTVTVKYRMWGSPGTAQQTHDVPTQVFKLAFVIDGETVWKSESSTHPPSFVQLNERESIDEAIQRVMKQQEGNLQTNYWGNVYLPAYFARVPGVSLEPERQQPKVKATPARTT